MEGINEIKKPPILGAFFLRGTVCQGSRYQEIPLSQQGSIYKGKYFAQVDDEDYEELIKWRWQAHVVTAKLIYAYREIRSPSSKTRIWMHRVILQLTNEELIADHKDHDGLNNQRSNLRIATKSQNQANSKSRANSSSKYLGVHKHGAGWVVQVSRDGKNKYVGIYKTEGEAALAYNEAAIKAHGEFANLNLM